MNDLPAAETPVERRADLIIGVVIGFGNVVLLTVLALMYTELIDRMGWWWVVPMVLAFAGSVWATVNVGPAFWERLWVRDGYKRPPIFPP